MSVDWTIGRVIPEAHRFLQARRGGQATRLDAELILGHVLKLSRLDLYLNHDRPLSRDERLEFKQRLRERASGKPTQLITGVQPFRRMVLEVGPGVFIPRPETEILVEEVLNRLDAGGEFQSILDIGTGSGAVGLALAQERPGLEVTAIDLNPDAVTLARKNASTYGLSDRVSVLEANFFSWSGRPETPYDAVVSNPPYVRQAELAALPTEVRGHDPAGALDGGQNGLAFYQRLVEMVGRHLRPSGILAVEIGADQGLAVRSLLGQRCTQVRLATDLAGRDRVVSGLFDR